jgi:hypothetical protein
MTSTYTANQGIEKPDTGDQSGTWGGTVNTNMDIIDRAISGVGSLTLTGSTTTLTTTDGSLTDGMYRVLVLGDGGDLGSDNTITLSPNDQDKLYLVYNNLSANRNAIFSQGTGANVTVSNGATAWIYADGAGSGAAVRAAMISTEISDQDGDTKIQVEEGGDDDDTIRFDIAGAEDFVMSANKFEVQTGSNIDMNGTELILDADGDTSITADTDDQIDIRIAGADDFQFTANTFTVPSGSTLEIASGGTIANSGTATGFGSGASAALDNLSSVAINTSLVSDTNNTDDLGTSSIAWKDLYIAGNIHIGGTGSANALDDYETGTFTPVLKFGTTNNTHASAPTSGFYTKVGPGINFSLIARMLDTISGTGSLSIEGLPFTANCPNVPMQAHATFNDYSNEDNVSTRVYDNTTVVAFNTVSNGSVGNLGAFDHTNFADGANKYTYVTGYYETD